MILSEILFEIQKTIDKNIYMLKKVNPNLYEATATIRRNKLENTYYKIIITSNNSIKCIEEKNIPKQTTQHHDFSDNSPNL